LLTEALSATRRAGNPDEFFDLVPANEAHWRRRFGAPDGPGYIDRIVEASRTPNGVFGFKLHWHQLPALRRRLIQQQPDAAPRLRRSKVRRLGLRRPARPGWD
jgi:LPS sulfotransferase NodH